MRLIIALLVLTLGGCGSIPKNEGSLTYKTVPPGASLYEGDIAFGLAPQQRNYRAKAGEKTVRTRVVTAIWPSGAKATYWTDLPTDGRAFDATISRPQEAPDAELETL